LIDSLVVKDSGAHIDRVQGGLHKMRRKLVVGAAQTGPVITEDPEAMLPAAMAMMDQAANRNVEIVTFSELFMTPFFPNRLRQDFDHFFAAPDGPLMTRLRGISKQHGIATIWPFGERTPGGGYFNSALACDERGEVLGIYRKTHIPAYFPDELQGGTGSYERLYFTPGPALPVFAWRGIKFGIQICYDRLFPEPSRVLTLQGAEIIFMPICYSTYSDPDHRAGIWEVPLRARAYENGVYVVAANRVGQEGIRHHLGRSMVVDPAGAIVAEAGSEKEDLLVAELDIERVRGDRRKIPWSRDRRIDLYEPLAR
jgi:N-carbamoylputrescine amidase